MTALKELQNYTFVSKYARWNKQKQRRETWVEAVDRVRQMMLEKYADKNIDDDINWAYDMMQKKKVLGSQRILQYGGRPALIKNARVFNCSGSHCNRLRFFQECFWMSLCGAGVGFSVQNHHVKQLPTFKSRDNLSRRTYIIEDSIEHWADALGELLKSYFVEPCNIDFDYTHIRPKGSSLSSGVGKAPGSDGLRNALHQIKILLNRCIKNDQKRLRPIDAYDIVCHVSNATLSGGLRRAALLAMFSLDDEEMMKAKTGSWREENPQRARANNSVVLLRGQFDKQTFTNIVNNCKEYGEPGFIFEEDVEVVINPCQPKWATVLTPRGISTVEDINVGDQIWSQEGWTTVNNKISTGYNNVYQYQTTANVFYGTDNHQVLVNGQKTSIQDAKSIDVLQGPLLANVTINQQDVMDGLVIGDGSVHKASNNLVYLCIGKNDQDYFADSINEFIIKYRPGLKKNIAYEIQTTIKYEELPLTYDRVVPKRFLYGNFNTVCGFLRGLYSANGGICGNRITLQASSLTVILNVQNMLSAIGIRSYYTTNKSKNIQFSNGKYKCKQSYDLNITCNRDIFAKYIGFIQQYKQQKLEDIIKQTRKQSHRKKTYLIYNNTLLSNEETFSLTVNNNSHTYWTNGCNVANCGEVSLYPIDIETNKSGWQVCNLCTINGSNIESLDDFLERAKAAAILGTLQAGFTKFDYLGSTSEKITEREALLGVSITGIMENDEIVLNKEYLMKVAKYILTVNKNMAKKIGINPAARATCLKPDGNTSCVLGVSAGVHPHHATRYLRRVQANRTETAYQWFRKFNSQACEKSVWDSNDTDDIIHFPIEVPVGAKTKNQLPALQMLEIVKDIQEYWVNNGKDESLCVKQWLNHSVSNTITVKDDEWSSVIDYIFDNQQYFNGITLIPISGDKDFPQAPLYAVHMSHEIVRQYGDGAIWCSGLIELGLSAFDNNLWAACDAILNKDFVKQTLKTIDIDKYPIVSSTFAKLHKQATFCEKAYKFAQKYFNDDFKKLTFCMKDVYNWKLYCDLKDSFQHVDYTQLTELEDNTKPEEEVSCSGGACLL